MSEEGQALGCVCAWGWVGGGGCCMGSNMDTLCDYSNFQPLGLKPGF